MVRYSKEFKADAVKLAQSGEKSVNAIADELGINRSSLRYWLSAVKPKSISGETAEEELMRLRKENRVLQMERDILKKQRPSLPRKINEISIHQCREGQLPSGNTLSRNACIARWILCMAEETF